MDMEQNFETKSRNLRNTKCAYGYSIYLALFTPMVKYRGAFWSVASIVKDSTQITFRPSLSRVCMIHRENNLLGGWEGTYFSLVKCH